MDSLLAFPKDRITDKMPLEEIVDVFEQMCRIPLKGDMILFETGTFFRAGTGVRDLVRQAVPKRRRVLPAPCGYSL